MHTNGTPITSPDDLQRTIIVPPGSQLIHRILPGPWLSVLGAARWLNYPCSNGRAPAGVYEIVQQIGVKLNGRWIVHCDDLDAYVRAQIGTPLRP